MLIELCAKSLASYRYNVKGLNVSFFQEPGVMIFWLVQMNHDWTKLGLDRYLKECKGTFSVQTKFDSRNIKVEISRLGVLLLP